MFHFQTHIGELSKEIMDTLIYFYKGMFYFLSANLFFCLEGGKIQTHSRCADHISQLDTLRPTHALDFFFFLTFKDAHMCMRTPTPPHMFILLHKSICYIEAKIEIPSLLFHLKDNTTQKLV